MKDNELQRFSSITPAMPKPTKGTEIVKLLLSQASKDMREPLLPMVMPAFAAHLCDVELMCSDNKYHELCGQMGHLIGPSGIGMDQLHDLVEAIKGEGSEQYQTLPKRKAVVQTTPNPS